MANTRRTTKVPGGPSHLGNFGTVKVVQAQTFGYFGETVRLADTLSELVFVDFMEAADAIDEKDPRSITLIKDFIREFVDPDDFERFWATARANRQHTADLLQLVKALTEAATGRPTGRRPGSSAGQGRTAAKSTASSSDRVLRQLDGRPDLQMAVVRARQARQAA